MSNVTQAWLEAPTSIQGVFVVVKVLDVLGTYVTAGTEHTFYLSNLGYMTTDSAVSFLPIIRGNVSYTESLSLDGGLSLSFGDIEIINHNGDYDTWLDSSKFVWVNRSVKIYIGDPTWPSANLAAISTNFQCVFDGVIGDIDSSSRESLNITIRDKLERLNTPITEVVIGAVGTWPGGQSNQDVVVPLVFGEVFNIEPVPIDPATLKYKFSTGNAERVLEIRDNGVPIHTSDGTSDSLTGATIDLTNGEFTLNKPPAGTITASVQGVRQTINLTTGALNSTTYTNNIANLVAVLATQYGDTNKLSATTELDLPSLNTFATNTQSVGLYVTDKGNVLTACQELVGSIGAQVYVNRLGQLQILRLGTYTTGNSPMTNSTPISSITDADILHHSLSISQRSEVIAGIKLGGCTNYTTQSGLQTGIPDAHKKLFDATSTTSYVKDSPTQTKYKISTNAEQVETLLINTTELASETTRRLNFYKTPRTVYRFTGIRKLWSLYLGQQVTLSHNRFGLSAGVAAQVISLSPNWVNGTVEVEVLI